MMEVANMETVKSINLITTNSNIRNGRPCVAGTSLEVAVIAVARIVHEHTPEQIAANYDLPLAEVYAALSYYYAHKTEIDADIRRQKELAQTLKERLIAQGHTPLLGRESES
jgi:uncharacterized protein (DUF433 family)